MSPEPSEQLQVVRRTDPPTSSVNDSIVMLTSAGAAILGIVFAVSLLAGASLPVYGTALALGLLLLGTAVRRYFTGRFPDIDAVEPREIPSPDDADEPLSDVAAIGPRRSFLKRVLVAATGVFGIALVTPVASLGPKPGDTLRRTAWAAGVRLVTTAGDPVRPDDVAFGGIASIWPEGAIGQERSSVLLVRLTEPPVPPTVLDWVVDERVVAYSKVCTHAGCPVALYRERDNALFCPCHQSTFAPSAGAIPTFGPTARALPQLPMGVDDEGYLVALGDFREHVGPALPRG